MALFLSNRCLEHDFFNVLKDKFCIYIVHDVMCVIWIVFRCHDALFAVSVNNVCFIVGTGYRVILSMDEKCWNWWL